MKRMEFVIGCLCLLLVLAAAPNVVAQTPAISPARVKARKELGQLCVEYSKSSFIKQAAEGDTIAVQLFLAAGIDPNVYDSPSSSNALMAAAREGHLETINLLLAGGANGNTALIVATRFEVLKLLLDHGADANTKGRYGETALMSATALGHADRVNLLLERGADVNAKDRGDGTALMKAVEAAVNTRDPMNGIPLTEEAVRQRTDTVKLLVARKAEVNAKDNEGKTALLIAAIAGAVDMEKFLLDHGAGVNARDKYGRTALNEAIQRGHTDLVKILLDKGADVNTGADSRTPLSLASALHKMDIVQLLISAGAKQ